jgi:site-specific DNA recombinase
MAVVRRIFRMVGVEGASIKSVVATLNREGVKPPVAPWSRSNRWGTTVIRDSIIQDDVYKPHVYEEIKALVAPEVAARLDPDKSYGVWWYNRTRSNTKQVAVIGANGKEYRRRIKYTPRPRAEWIAVPVPDSGVPLECVDAARETIENNQRNSNAGRRFWELSGGILRCGTCGYAMVSHTTTPTAKSGMYFYYVCRTRYIKGRGACTGTKHFPVAELEARVWKAISNILKDPKQLRADLDAMIELERYSMSGEPDKEIKLWANKLAEVDRKRARYQEMAADDLITFNELRARLAELDDARKTAECELDALRQREEHLNGLKQDRDALLDSLEGVAPDALDALTSEERRRVYQMLRLKIAVHPDGSLEANGVFGDDFKFCEPNTVRSPRAHRGWWRYARRAASPGCC